MTALVRRLRSVTLFGYFLTLALVAMVTAGVLGTLDQAAGSRPSAWSSPALGRAYVALFGAAALAGAIAYAVRLLRDPGRAARLRAVDPAGFTIALLCVAEVTAVALGILDQAAGSRPSVWSSPALGLAYVALFGGAALAGAIGFARRRRALAVGTPSGR